MNNKIREALSDACYAMFNFLKTRYGCRYAEMAKALDKAKAALAEPLRNCDVGTAEEQSFRFENFCFNKNQDCDDCPLMDFSGRCELAWAQMSYEEKENSNE